MTDENGDGDESKNGSDSVDRDSYSPTAGEDVVLEDTGLSSTIAHLYRGEMDRVVAWRERLDQTTNWAVTVMAAILTFAFSSEENPHYVLLIGMLLVAVFLGIETRRFLGYDVWRSRVRVMQESLFAIALDPSQGLDEAAWRETLGADYRHPSQKLSLLVALAHRLRRVYLPLFLVLLAAWVFRITAFDPDESALETATAGMVPGSIVVTVVTGGALAAFVLAFFPRLYPGYEGGEFSGIDAEWKEWPEGALVAPSEADSATLVHFLTTPLDATIDRYRRLRGLSREPEGPKPLQGNSSADVCRFVRSVIVYNHH